MLAVARDTGSRPAARLSRVALGLICAVFLVGATKAPAAAPGKPAASKPAANNPNVMDPRADAALLVDVATGSVLFEKNADRPLQLGNLTKLMTVVVTAREIQEGRLSLDSEFPISTWAWKTGGAPSHGTTMFAPINSKVKVADLISGVAVQMANDGAIALAEGIAGAEGAFSDLMNKRATEMGLQTAHFANPSGLPNPGNTASARDLYKISRALIVDYPDIYKFYGQREFTFNKIRQFNRNPLINEGVGGDGVAVDGFKGSAPGEGGYNIVGSAVQNNQRLIVVVGAAAVEKERNEDARKLLEWGFRTFESFRLYHAGEAIGEATVFGGAAKGVKVAAETNVDILIPRGNRDKLRGKVVYTGPIKAPISKGQPVGHLIVTRNDTVIQDVPVTAIEDVAVGDMRQRAIDGTRELLLGLFRR